MVLFSFHDGLQPEPDLGGRADRDGGRGEAGARPGREVDGGGLEIPGQGWTCYLRAPGRVVCLHDHRRGDGQPLGDLGGYQESRHANGAQRFHRELGRLGPHALSDHDAAYPRRDPVHDMAGKH